MIQNQHHFTNEHKKKKTKRKKIKDNEIAQVQERGSCEVVVVVVVEDDVYCLLVRRFLRTREREKNECNARRVTVAYESRDSA